MKNNILIIVSDQLSQKAVGAYGNKDCDTTNIDKIAKNGVRFANAYSPYPLCCPARAAFWTGLLPHDTGVVSNGREYPITPVDESVPTLGSLFKAHGYETVHFGKTHDAGTLRGFDCAPEGELELEGTEAWPIDYDTRRDAYTTERCVEYLNQSHDKPFIMVADIQNPHDICNWVGAFPGPHEDLSGPGELPPLPDNFEINDISERPTPVQYICCSHHRLSQAARWNENNYRHYLAAYYHYVNRADKDIGRILDALAESDAADNTLIVFFADHGDGMASHRMVTKQVSFYEETTRVPFIFSGSGISFADKVEESALVSLCDLLPTLCDYAGLEAPENIYGKSLMPWLNGESPANWRDFVVSEWVTEWGFTTAPGRMVRGKRFKYTNYLENNGEELFDLINDPGESKTLINDPNYADVLEEYREILRKHIQATDDNYQSLEIKADNRWRSHELGYQYHNGPAAPMAKG